MRERVRGMAVSVSIATWVRSNIDGDTSVSIGFMCGVREIAIHLSASKHVCEGARQLGLRAQPAVVVEAHEQPREVRAARSPAHAHQQLRQLLYQLVESTQLQLLGFSL